MKKFAIVNSNAVVENIVVSEEYSAIEFLLGFDKLIIEETEATGVPFIGATYRQDKAKFMPYRPFDTWSFNDETWAWEAPIAKPEAQEGFLLTWDGLANNWTEIAIPTEEPSE